VLKQIRDLYFSYYDFLIHCISEEDLEHNFDKSMEKIFNECQKYYPFINFPDNGEIYYFTHLFSEPLAGYAASYYQYSYSQEMAYKKYMNNDSDYIVNSMKTGKL
jgi:Zn-dependent oligopeptidase